MQTKPNQTFKLTKFNVYSCPVHEKQRLTSFKERGEDKLSCYFNIPITHAIYIDPCIQKWYFLAQNALTSHIECRNKLTTFSNPSSDQSGLLQKRPKSVFLYKIFYHSQWSDSSCTRVKSVKRDVYSRFINEKQHLLSPVRQGDKRYNECIFTEFSIAQHQKAIKYSTNHRNAFQRAYSFISYLPI